MSGFLFFASIFDVADYGGAGKLGNRGGVICTPIVDDSDLVHILPRLKDYTSDIPCFIIGRYASQDANPVSGS